MTTMSSGSPPATKFLKPMNKGEALSIKSLNAQINAMMQATCFIEDEDTRIQFLRRVEVVQTDLHCLRSEFESRMPEILRRPSTLNIDHVRHLIGSPEEGYIPLTKKNRKDVIDIAQRIDRLSEGLVLVVQRQQASESNDDHYPHSDSGVSDTCVQDTNQQTPYPRSTNELGGTNYAFQYSQSTSDGHQVQISYARRYYHPSSNSQGNQHNQFTLGPNYFNSQPPTMIHNNDRSSQLEATRHYFHGLGYSTGDNLGYLPRSGHSHYGEPSSYYVPQPGPSFWRTPSDIQRFSEFNNNSLIRYRGSSLPEYSRGSQGTGARHADFSRYSQGYNRIG